MSTAVSTATPRAGSTTSGPRRRRLGSTGIVYLALVGILVVSAGLVAAQGGSFFSQGNLFYLLSQTSLLGFVAIGQTFVILCKSLDLSVGYVVAWSSLVAATTMAGDPSRIWLGVVAALAVAAGVGLVNGLVISKLRVNSFIATLGVGLIIKGYLDTQFKGPSGEVPKAFQGFGYTRIGPVPVSVVVLAVVMVLGVVLLTRTRPGYHMFAVGGNIDVARLSGIRTDRSIILAHVLCSLCAGIAGLLIAARFGTGNALVYTYGYDLNSIAAVVLGGTLLMGGRGSILGTIAGVLILASLDTVFNVLDVSPFFKDVLRGAIIIAAVAMYARRQIDPASSRARFKALAQSVRPGSRGGPGGASSPDPTGPAGPGSAAGPENPSATTGKEATR
ncbi:ABC transporter permease [Oerskovia sp. KBS0722]|uniref:ABC transporter permease n=1 Tax=Oerskovia sp. KBS0722 TaxID=1179673 RepID=UPI00110F4991|nr:ABC transporter permease [Oerskovia sp. KBS0722]QDW64026.1 ABC transporter permease [Oerskovia sp. KBS0722]